MSAVATDIDILADALARAARDGLPCDHSLTDLQLEYGAPDPRRIGRLWAFERDALQHACASSGFEIVNIKRPAGAPGKHIYLRRLVA